MIADAQTLEWQVAEGSRTWHVMDTTRPGWRNPDGSRRRCGPRSLCGRYPQRNAEFPWLKWSASEPEVVRHLTRHYGLRQCEDCLDALSNPPGQERRSLSPAPQQDGDPR